MRVALLELRFVLINNVVKVSGILPSEVEPTRVLQTLTGSDEAVYFALIANRDLARRLSSLGLLEVRVAAKATYSEESTWHPADQREAVDLCLQLGSGHEVGQFSRGVVFFHRAIGFLFDGLAIFNRLLRLLLPS